MAAHEREGYTLGYGPLSTASMAARRLDRYLPFVASGLRPDMRVLDLGCGPGAITMEMAGLVASAVGVDVEATQIDLANKTANERGIENVEFRTASAYEVPYETHSFDVVVLAALLGNLKHPDRALVEARRLLRPGGVIAVKEFDLAADLCDLPAEMGELLDLGNRLREDLGHDYASGRKIVRRLVENGFEHAEAHASFVTTPPSEMVTLGKDLADWFREAWREPILERGWKSQEELDAQLERCERHGPVTGFLASAWVEALARSPES